MAVNVPEFNRQLATALAAYDWELATDLSRNLVDAIRRRAQEDVVSIGDVKRTLNLLRRKRLFRLMQEIADAFLAAGIDHPTVRRQYAQCLLDQGSVSAALPILEPLVSATAGDPFENAEARGLVGRAYKQIYVDGWVAGTTPNPRAQAHLDHAVRAYWQVYASDQTRLWHGINVVALLARAKRDGVALQGYPNHEDVARQILGRVSHLHETVDQTTTSLLWDYATAVEACIALDRADESLDWLVRYLSADGADAFELSSTHRQFREIWQLTSSADPGARVLPLLSAALMQHEGGSLSQAPADFAPGGALQQLDRAGTLQSILGDTRYVAYQWWLQAVERCRAVALITDEYGKGVGTGFLVKGADVHKKLAGETVLLTNAHVVSSDPKAHALRPARARVTFTVAGSPSCGVKEVVWTSGPWSGELDTSLLRIDVAPTDVVPCPVCPDPVECAPNQRLYVIGHPLGGALSLSVQDNRLIGVTPPYLHYRTPTEQGHSGSPVFNEHWELVGIHHLGDTRVEVPAEVGRKAANEGVLFHDIRRALERLL